jgi:hypothetical protein
MGAGLMKMSCVNRVKRGFVDGHEVQNWLKARQGVSQRCFC